MPRIKRTNWPTTARQRIFIALCAGMFLAALPLGSSQGPLGPAQAFAQEASRATRVLFLAVEKNDLPGVQAAINGGADVHARNLSGMQAVDLAIERGYFDIAHYLISVRNQMDANGKSTKPAPSLEELAQARKKQSAQQAVETANNSPAKPTSALSAPNIPPGTPNPFDAPNASNGLPVVGPVTEPAKESASSPAETPAAETPAVETPAVETPAVETMADVPAQTDSLAAKETQATKPSAVKTFFSTFTDFFKPPNTTGIVRKETPVGADGQDALTEEELAQQLKQIEKDMGNAPIKGPAVPITPEEMARELPPAPAIPDNLSNTDIKPLETTPLPPYSVTETGAPPEATKPEVSSNDAFGDLTIANVSKDDAQPLAGSTPASTSTPVRTKTTAPKGNPNLPFNGGVDPRVLKLLGMDTNTEVAQADTSTNSATDSIAKPADAANNASDPFATPADPFAEPADPFATPAQKSAPADDPFAAPPHSGPDSVSGVLGKIAPAQEVKPVKTNKPGIMGAESTDSASADPFAAPPLDPTTGAPAGEVDELAGLLQSTGEKIASKQDGWDVKEVDGQGLPAQVPAAVNVEPTGKTLDGVQLALGADTVIDQPVGDDRLKMMTEETIHKPCMEKGGPQTVYCVDKVSWPFELEEDFLVDTIMYQGTRAIARYDAGRATNFHVLFNTGAFNKIVNYYITRFGQPSEKVDRAIAPLAQPRRDNPTYIWHSREPGTDTVTTLEIREFDDARGGFPDIRRGAILLYREHAGSIFPQLSQLELMVLKDSGAMDLAPKTPDSVW